jgi:predicted ATPase
VPLTTFFGRDAEQAALVELVSSWPLVTVTGPGGVGKTRLLRETEQALRALTDELVVAELAELPPNATPTVLSGHLGFASAESVAVALGRCCAVLVLDNCEHVLDTVSLFVQQALAAETDLRIVTTSREPLHLEGERVLVLDPLPVPDGPLDVETSASVQLFLDRAASAGAPWPASPEILDQVGELCRRLDGLPLAIELAAARTRALSPAELLDIADGSLEVLSRPHGAGDARHQSVRRSIEASVELLPDDERAMFARLGLFAGPFDADLAHAVAPVADADRLRVIDLLSRLVDRSLVVAEHANGTTRYRLLELLREYAVDLLVAGGEADTAHDRYVDAITARADAIVIEALEGWSVEVLEAIAAVSRNLLNALDWCIEHGLTPERAFRLYLPLFAVVHQSRSHEVFEIGERIFSRWPDEPAPWRAEALAVVATAAAIGERRDAIGEALTADRYGQLALDDDSTTDVARMVAHRALGLSARTRNDFEAARLHFASGRDSAARIGAQSFARELAGFEAGALDLLGQTDEALIRLEGVIDESVKAQDWFTVVWARLVASTALMRLGRWEEAEAEADRARQVIGGLGDPWWQGAVLRQFAVLAATKASTVGMNRGWEASMPFWLEAVEQAGGRGSPGEVAMTLRSAAVIASQLGETATAEALLDAAPALTELTVLPELFPEEAERLRRDHDAGPGPPTLTEALRRARAVLVATESEPAGPPEARPERPTAALRRDGDTWEIEYGGSSTRVRHLKGLIDLAVLLERPDVDVHCLELMGATDVGRSTGPTLDDRAKREYQKRITELQNEIDEANQANDHARAERSELELDALVQQLSEAFGLGGRDRPTGAASERARTAVAYRLRAALRRIDEAHPELGRHLDNAVRTGTWCSYRPETAVEWDVRV